MNHEIEEFDDKDEEFDEDWEEGGDASLAYENYISGFTKSEIAQLSQAGKLMRVEDFCYKSERSDHQRHHSKH